LGALASIVLARGKPGDRCAGS